jgi:hypothetical protein
MSGGVFAGSPCQGIRNVFAIARQKCRHVIVLLLPASSIARIQIGKSTAAAISAR